MCHEKNRDESRQNMNEMTVATCPSSRRHIATAVAFSLATPNVRSVGARSSHQSCEIRIPASECGNGYVYTKVKGYR